ncbi:NAD(P)-binding protein [Mycena olivaceomarginata]|nr:NAD(P)-binding protein [Mycena olivaceomarginata]
MLASASQDQPPESSTSDGSSDSVSGGLPRTPVSTSHPLAMSNLMNFARDDRVACLSASAAASKLKDHGVEVVKGDAGDKASLVSAVRGSEAIFAMTVPVISLANAEGAPDEITQGKNIVDAAKEAGVKFLVFTSLPDLSKLSGGKYKDIPPHDDKQIVHEHLKSSGLPHAILYLGGFAENFWKWNFLRKTPTGFNISIPNYSPTSLQCFTWVEHDVSESSLAVLKSYTDPSKNLPGKTFPVVTGIMTYSDLAAMTARVTFTSIPTSGIPTLDRMFAARSEHNELVALGAKFGTMEEFMGIEVKKRFT